MLLSLVVSTVVFFVASYFIKRWADDNELPRGMTRGVAVFIAAALLASAAGWVVEKLLA